MPGLVNGRKRTLSPESDNEDEDAVSQASERLGSAAKRVRTNGQQSSSPRPVLPSSYRTDSCTDQNGTDIPILKHQPGSIKRVLMRNFVTYKEAEFLPGPSLNMVIGPNGTGKSTLVCAICLGLGWRTEHLGRAKDIGEFIRHGCDTAEIEIELQRDPTRHDRNPIIKAVIKRSSGHRASEARKTGETTFYLNGRQVSRKRVVEECKSFSIQVDNLCQFLPQDRVVEFAALNPVDLLSQTLRAAAPEEMTAQHEELKELHADQARFTADQKTHSENLLNLESRHNAQRTDVERFQERVTIQKRISALDMFKPALEYAAAKTRWDAAKTRKREAENKLQELSDQLAPTLHSVEEKSLYVQEVRDAVKRLRKVVERSEKHAVEVFKKQEKFVDEINVCHTEKETEGKRDKQLRQTRARIKKAIGEIEVQMKSAPPEVDFSKYNEDIRDLARQVRELDDKITEAKAKQDECGGQIGQRQRRIAELESSRQALQSKAGRQEAKLERTSADTFRAWRWVQAHKSAFKAEVYGPPMLICSVKDQHYADAVESAFGKSDMLALTVTNDEDFQTLQRELGNQKLSDIYIRSSRLPLTHYKPNVPREQLTGLGLDGYIVDLLDGPEAVLGMLCDGRSIHQTAVATRNLTSAQIDTIRETDITTFVTRTEVYTTTRRREYGAAGTSTRTRKAKRAEIFNDSAVDIGADNEIKQQILELKDEIETLKKEYDQHKEAAVNVKNQLKDTREQHDDLKKKKDQLQAVMAKFNALPAHLNIEQDKLQAKQDDLDQVVERMKAFDDKIREKTMARSKEADNFIRAVDTAQKTHLRLFEAEIILIEAESDLETLESKNAEVTAMLDQANAEVETVKEDLRRAHTEAHSWLDKTNEMRERRTDEEKAIHDEISVDQSVEDLQNEIEGLQARLELVHEGNVNVVKEYEERALRIEKIKDKLERIGRDLAILDRKIIEIRSVWEPEVDRLISQISDAFGDNFNRIGCAGEVEVNKTEDFSEWSILIMVKFREHEQLSVLDSHRQSGGERAVSTIFYLMALQSLARAPFRVVDEINQGMDPRNERLVHARMVDIACAEHTSQYFLITPKLLPNLKYDPRMKIHCIASGEYMPEDFQQLNFQALVAKAVGVQRRISGVMG